MPYGKGTYGSKVGRPPKNKKNNGSSKKPRKMTNAKTKRKR